MRYRASAPQTDWFYPPMYRLGATGNTLSGGSIAPPSLGQTYPATGMLVFGATTGTVILDLSTICGPPTKTNVPQGNDDWSPNPIGHSITMQADGDNIYYAFGDSPAALAALSPTVVTAIDGGTITGLTGAAATTFTQVGGTSGCAKLVKDALPQKFNIPYGPPPPRSPTDNADIGQGKYSPARYLAFQAGATSVGVYLRIWPVSD